MKKLLLVLMVIIVSNSFAGLGWYQDYVIVKVNNVLVNTTGYMWIGSDPSYGTQFHGYNLGSSVNSIILGCDMRYWSDNQDRTGGHFIIWLSHPIIPILLLELLKLFGLRHTWAEIIIKGHILKTLK